MGFVYSMRGFNSRNWLHVRFVSKQRSEPVTACLKRITLAAGQSRNPQAAEPHSDEYSLD
jgi:hypothetical protein